MTDRPPDEAPITYRDLRRAVARLMRFQIATFAYLNARGEGEAEAAAEFKRLAVEIEQAYGLDELFASDE